MEGASFKGIFRTFPERKPSDIEEALRLQNELVCDYSRIQEWLLAHFPSLEGESQAQWVKLVRRVYELESAVFLKVINQNSSRGKFQAICDSKSWQKFFPSGALENPGQSLVGGDGFFEEHFHLARELGESAFLSKVALKGYCWEAQLDLPKRYNVVAPLFMGRRVCLRIARDLLSDGEVLDQDILLAQQVQKEARAGMELDTFFNQNFSPDHLIQFTYNSLRQLILHHKAFFRGKVGIDKMTFFKKYWKYEILPLWKEKSRENIMQECSSLSIDGKTITAECVQRGMQDLFAKNMYLYMREIHKNIFGSAIKTRKDLRPVEIDKEERKRRWKSASLAQIKAELDLEKINEKERKKQLQFSSAEALTLITESIRSGGNPFVCDILGMEDPQEIERVLSDCLEKWGNKN